MSDEKRKSVLIIESAGEDREVIGDFLHALGYDVIYAGRGNEGIRQFTQNAPDLVLVEILLSGMNGLSVCKIIKDQESWAKVVVLSKLYQSANMRKEAVSKWKADGYLEKPFELHELRDIVFGLIGEPEQGPQDLPEESSLREEMHRRRPSSMHSEPSRSPAAQPEPVPDEDRDRPAPKEQAAPAPVAEPGPRPELADGFPESAAPKSDDGFEASGVFDPASLAGILRRVASERLSGMLKLVAGDLAKIVYLVDGTPVFVKSSLRSETLGNLLLAQGRISEQALREALSRMQETGRKLGSTLVAMGTISSDELTEFITRQTAVKLVGVFSWEGGRYEFEPKSGDEMNAPLFPVRIPEMLLSALDTYMTPENLAERFRNDAGCGVRLETTLLAREATAFLTDQDRLLLSRLENAATAGEALRESGLEISAGLRAFYRLLTAGVVSLGPSVSAPEPAAPSASSGFDDDFDIPAESPLTLEGEDASPPPEEPAPEPRPRMTAEEMELLERIAVLHGRLDQIGDYEILGCSPEDPARAIKEAYRSLKGRYAEDALPAVFDDSYRAMAAEIGDRVRAAYESVKAERKRSRPAAPEEEDAEFHMDGETRQDMAESEMLYRDGLALLEEKRFGAAISKLEQACRLNENESDYWAMCGWAIYRMLREAPRTVDEATNMVKKSLILNAGSELAHHTLARMHAGEGNGEAAVKFYKKTLSINPQNLEAQRELRELERLLAREPEALSKRESLLFKKLW